MRYHPFTEVWPLMRGEDFEKLKADIAANGLRLPILTYAGQIIDGRNRARACEDTGVAPRYEESGAASDAEALKFIDSLNDQRRHLSAEQRAFAAAQLAQLKRGGNGSNQYKIANIANERLAISETATLREAAAKLNVSHGAAARARAVLTYGTESDKNDVIDGKVSLSRKAESLVKRQPRKMKAAKPPKRDKRGRPSKNEPKINPVAIERLKPTARPLTRQEVDPEFTGTDTEWVMKYGHVQMMTAKDYATDRFGSWAQSMRFLAKTVKDLPDVDHNWLRSPKATDIAKMTEALEALRPRMVEAEALLKRALQSVKQPELCDA